MVAIVWVHNSQGEVLMRHRSPEHSGFPNTWDVSAAGHVRSGDSAIASAVRELREELGIQVRPGDMIEIGRVKDEFPLTDGKTHREHDVVYLVRHEINLERVELQSSETDGARWMDMRDLAAEMDDVETRNQYAARNPETYRLALEAIWNMTAPN
jgi:isopentenyldiphosphate isomerase